MKIFIVFAHPEPTSLNSYLKDRAVAAMQDAGHEIEVSDLYAMRWKAVADAADFPARDASKPLNYAAAAGEAYVTGQQSPDIVEEQRKLLWADAVVLQFPLWWYGMPAIMKGWIDRVYAIGFAAGRPLPGDVHGWVRFGQGALEGRRAMVVTTIGGRAPQYGPRGVDGHIDYQLWPIQHGLLFYPGMTVVPPTVFYDAMRSEPDAVELMVNTYVDRLLTIKSVEPIPFRLGNGGDYDEHMTLRQALEGDAKGTFIHQAEPRFVSNTLLGPRDGPLEKHFALTSRDCCS